MPLTIDITSDTVCPWCFVGKRRLEQALDARANADKPSIRWFPFQLDPHVPQSGVPLKQYLAGKFGPRERWQPMLDRLAGVGAECGISFAWDRIDVRPNSIDSHRVIRWAAEAGLQDEVVEAIFVAYWEQARDIGSAAVLAELAGDAGMDANDVARRLASDADRATVLSDALDAGSRGITGVPDFVVGNKFRLVGAQPPYYFERALQRVAATS